MSRLKSAIKPRIRAARNNKLSACLASIMLAMAGHVAAQTDAPTEDGLWYYEIGGADPVSLPASPRTERIRLGGSVQLGLGYSCAAFDPVAAVSNSLNDISSGVDDMMDAMTAAATNAIAALPALILQRANPGLYDLFQNALLKAEETMQIATKSCETMEAEIAQGKHGVPAAIEVVALVVEAHVEELVRPLNKGRVGHFPFREPCVTERTAQGVLDLSFPPGDLQACDG